MPILSLTFDSVFSVSDREHDIGAESNRIDNAYIYFGGFHTVTASGTITANAFVGDGSGLTGISTSSEWGSVSGTITDQTDLIAYISSQIGGIEVNALWGSVLGTITDQTDLANYVADQIYNINNQDLLDLKTNQTFDYVVDKILGDDNNDGSPGSPFQTLTALRAQIDTILEGVSKKALVKSGTYVDEHLDIAGLRGSLELVFESRTTIQWTQNVSKSGIQVGPNPTGVLTIYGNGLRITGFNTGTGNGLGCSGNTLYAYDVNVDDCQDGMSAHLEGHMALYRCKSTNCHKYAAIHVGSSTFYHEDCFFQPANDASSNFIFDSHKTSTSVSEINPNGRNVRCTFIPSPDGTKKFIGGGHYEDCQIGDENLAVEGTNMRLYRCYVNGLWQGNRTVSMNECWGRANFRLRDGGQVDCDRTHFVGPSTGSSQGLVYSDYPPAAFSKVTLKDCIVQGYNTAIVFSGRKSLWDASGSTIDNCVFSNNTTNFDTEAALAVGSTITNVVTTIPPVVSSSPSGLEYQSYATLNLEPQGFPLIVKDSSSSNVWEASKYGVSPLNSGSENSTALQALVDHASSSGGGTIKLPQGLIWLSNIQDMPIDANRGVCIVFKTGVYLKGHGPGSNDSGKTGTVLKLTANQTTDAKPVEIFAGVNSITDFGVEDLRISNNADNGQQSGWTLGYGQSSHGGSGIRLGGGPATEGPTNRTYNFRCVNVVLENCYGCPINCIFSYNSYVRKLECHNCGEGAQWVNQYDLDFDGYVYTDVNDIGVGDGFELANGNGAHCRNFNITMGINAGGSCIDVSGRNYWISDGTLFPKSNAISVQADGANPTGTNPDNVNISNMNCTNVNDSGVGTAYSTMANSLTPSRVTWNNCHGINVDRGMIIQPQQGSSPYMKAGEVVINNCTFKDVQNDGFIFTDCGLVKGQGNSVVGDVSSSPRYGILCDASVDGQTVLQFGCDISDFDNYGIGMETGTEDIHGYVRGRFERCGSSQTFFRQNAPVNPGPGTNFIAYNERGFRDIQSGQNNGFQLAGESQFVYTGTEIRQIYGHHRQIIYIFFTQNGSINDVSQGSGRNIKTLTGSNKAMTPSTIFRGWYDKESSQLIEF